MWSQRKKSLGVFLLSSLLLLGAVSAYAQEEALFTSVAPDALIILDLSRSMRWTPAGGRMYTNNINNCSPPSGAFSGAFWSNSGSGHTLGCDIPSSADPMPKYAETNACAEPFYTASGTGHTVDCSRLAIAKRALFDMLDDNNSNTITGADETSLGIRIGYMHFYNCSGDETTGVYDNGCIRKVWGISSKYSRIFCNRSASCSPTDSGAFDVNLGGDSVNSESAYGGTPLASALNEAKLYLDAHKAGDSSATCRQKFAILITDGADTFACGGNGEEDQTTQYKRRKALVARTKELADAGYRTFVVGFGVPMPHWLRNTLNWAAYYGGTDNPIDKNKWDTSAYTPSASFCDDSNTAYDNADGGHWYATDGADPGEIDLEGYAFLASDAAGLTTALKQAMDMIRESTYSFSLSSVSSQRTQDENYLYEASFQPRSHDPFWFGHLKKYAINADGTVGNALWDAGDQLQAKDAGARHMRTLIGGSTTDFTTSISPIYFGFTASDPDAPSKRDGIVQYFRGDPNPDYWKLGDIFRSNPVTIGTPSGYYMDVRDANDAFGSFRSGHVRTSGNSLRVIVAGGNDGQLHAFQTLDGGEVWSFIPPNLLTKLKNVAHPTDPSLLTHQYFVDGPISAADVWFGSDGTAKSPNDWHTWLVFGEGRGGGSTLWSSSSSCDSGFNATYNATYPYYCGYYAMDLTNPTGFVYKWTIKPNVDQYATKAPHLGEPWSKMVMGRVIMNGNEKWVGFIGAGYNGGDCAGGGECDLRGKGFFVINLLDGEILWSYTRANNATMNYSLPSTPAIVDTDNDGFIDTAYMGDLGGSMWRFKFCTKAQGDCGTGSWVGTRLYEASTGEIRPIFTTPAVAKDRDANLWVQWGTGDKTDPTAANDQEKFYAVKDNDRTTTFHTNDLDNITTGSYLDTPNKRGWYINLQNEKVLAEPAIFGGVAYFTTYTAPSGGNPCDQAGTGKFYGVNFTTGAGVIAQYDEQGQPIGTPTRSMVVGYGIPTAPVISFKPVGTTQAGGSPADIYLTVSGGAGMNVSTQRVNFDPPTLANRTNLLYWKDRRLE